MKNFCVTPFTSLLVRADASTSCCCMNQGSADKNGENVYLYRDSLDDAWTSPFLTELRKSMLKDERHPSCSTCWKQEDAGFSSKRQGDNFLMKYWVDKVLAGEAPEGPIDLSLNLGTLCNLKCRICGSSSSSRWPQEYLELFGEDHVPRNNDMIRSMSKEESRALLVNWPYRDPRFTETLFRWLPLVQNFEFLGGEPFLNQKQFEIVRKCVELGCAKNQQLNFVTNSTIFPEEAARELWPHFKSVLINVSADGIGEHFEYQRYGANWENCLKNIERYRSLDCVDRVSVYVSISMFSVYYLPEIFAYWASKGIMNFISIVTSPDRCDARSLPRALKDRVRERLASHTFQLPPHSQSYLKQVEEFMYSEDRSHVWPKAIESIWFHDKYRKQDFAKTFPEFHAEAMKLGCWFDYSDVSQKERFMPELATRV